MDKEQFKEMIDIAIAPTIHKIDHSIYLKQNKLLSQYGITLQQSMVLAFLWLNMDKALINQKSVEEFMELKGPSVTSLIHKMVEKGLIKRSQYNVDARNFKLELTEKGREVNGICMDAFVDMNATIKKNLSSDELNTLKYLLNKIVLNLEE